MTKICQIRIRIICGKNIDKQTMKRKPTCEESYNVDDINVFERKKN